METQRREWFKGASEADIDFAVDCLDPLDPEEFGGVSLVSGYAPTAVAAGTVSL